MATRTRSKNVVSLRPFILDGFDAVQPAGIYQVDTLEERLGTLTLSARTRIGTAIHIARSGGMDHLPIDPTQLHEALMRDGAQADSCSPPPPRS